MTSQIKPEKAKKAKNSPSPEQVDFFFRRVKHFQSLLNLNDWRIENSGRSAGRGCLADVGVSEEDKLAVVSIGSDWGSMPINEKTLNETSAHEVLHVFLRSLITAAQSRDPAALASAEHSTVIILEKILTGDL
jgi:hypothetical protein